jgi:hypothetical protein
MSYTTTQLDTEQRTSIRAHYVTGHFDREEALTRIQNGGFSQLSREQACEVLALPITPHDVAAWTGRQVTEEQIAARLAEVSEPTCCDEPMVHNAFTDQYECMVAFTVLNDEGIDPYLVHPGDLEPEQRAQHAHWKASRRAAGGTA